MKPNLGTLLVYAEEAAQRAEAEGVRFRAAAARFWKGSPEEREFRDCAIVREGEAEAIRDAMHQCKLGNY